MKRWLILPMFLLALAIPSCDRDDDAKDTVQQLDTASPQDAQEADTLPADQDTQPQLDTASRQDLPAAEVVMPEEITALKAFGETCEAAEECADGVCHGFGDGSSLCTMTCETGDTCPEGSDGKKCNNKGVCKP